MMVAVGKRVTPLAAHRSRRALQTGAALMVEHYNALADLMSVLGAISTHARVRWSTAAFLQQAVRRRTEEPQ